MTKMIDIVDQSKQVVKLCEKILKRRNALQLVQMSEKPASTPAGQDEVYDNLADQLQDAMNDLTMDVLGARAVVHNKIGTLVEPACFQIACEFDLFAHVPLNGEISIADLSKASALPQDDLSRVMHLLATTHFFRETKPDVFAHSPCSALLAEDKPLAATFAFSHLEFLQGTSAAASALRSKVNGRFQTPFEASFGKSLYEYCREHKPTSDRLGTAMADRMPGLDEQKIADSIPRRLVEGSTIVDVGGGSGHISFFLAKQYPNMKFIVQDQQDMLALADQSDMQETNGRVTLEAKDYFQTQERSSVDAYFFRRILHQHTDEDCIKVLRTFVSAMEQNPKISLLISDIVLPEMGGANTQTQERALRQRDIGMMIVHNAKERTVADFERLVAAADPRFQVVNVLSRGFEGLVEVQMNVAENTAAVGVDSASVH